MKLTEKRSEMVRRESHATVGMTSVETKKIQNEHHAIFDRKSQQKKINMDETDTAQEDTIGGAPHHDETIDKGSIHNSQLNEIKEEKKVVSKMSSMLDASKNKNLLR